MVSARENFDEKEAHIHSSPFCLANEVLRCWSRTGGLFCYLQIVWNGCEYITVACKCANAAEVYCYCMYIRFPPYILWLVLRVMMIFLSHSK